MDYELQVTQTAEGDLDAILTYIMIELQNAEAAVHFVDQVDEHYDKLIDNPYIYEECRQPLLKQSHYRKVIVGSYLSIFRIDDENHAVYVERFFSSMQDYASKL